MADEHHPHERTRYRLTLIGGMGGFLVIALAIPDAYDATGLTFGLGYLVVVLLHAAMYVKGTSVSETAAILRIVPFNLVGVTLLIVGGALGGTPQWALWTLAAALLWLTPYLTTTEGFVVSPSHFVERHGLVIIIALGESIVVIGAGASGLAVDAELCSSRFSRWRSARPCGGCTSATRARWRRLWSALRPNAGRSSR